MSEKITAGSFIVNLFKTDDDHIVTIFGCEPDDHDPNYVKTTHELSQGRGENYAEAFLDAVEDLDQ